MFKAIARIYQNHREVKPFSALEGQSKLPYQDREVKGQRQARDISRVGGGDAEVKLRYELLLPTERSLGMMYEGNDAFLQFHRTYFPTDGSIVRADLEYPAEGSVALDDFVTIGISFDPRASRHYGNERYSTGRFTNELTGKSKVDIVQAAVETLQRDQAGLLEDALMKHKLLKPDNSKMMRLTVIHM